MALPNKVYLLFAKGNRENGRETLVVATTSSRSASPAPKAQGICRLDVLIPPGGGPQPSTATSLRSLSPSRGPTHLYLETRGRVEREVAAGSACYSRGASTRSATSRQSGRGLRGLHLPARVWVFVQRRRHRAYGPPAWTCAPSPRRTAADSSFSRGSCLEGGAAPAGAVLPHASRIACDPAPARILRRASEGLTEVGALTPDSPPRQEPRCLLS